MPDAVRHPQPPGQAIDGRSSLESAWSIVVVLMLAMVFSLIDRFALAVLVEPIKADLGIGDRQVGLLTGVAFGLFYAVMGLPLGFLADRWSRKGTILLGILVWGIATASSGMASSFHGLLAARVFVGAGEAALAPAGFSMIYDLFPRRLLGRAISVFQIGATVGSGFALFAVGRIYSWVQGGGAPWLTGAAFKPWQATFVIAALPGLLFLAVLACIREPARRVSTKEEGPAGMLATLASAKFFYAMLFATMACVLVVTFALLSWVPAIGQREFMMTLQAVGSRYGLIVLFASTGGMLAGGVIADRLDRTGVVGAHVIVLLAAVALGLLAMALLGAAQSANEFFMLVALAHAALALPVGVAPALVQLRTPVTARARVSALYLLIVNVFGLGFGPVVIGYVSQALGTKPDALRLAVTATTSVALAISLACATTLYRAERLSVRKTFVDR